jgi:hypothetical protein
MGRKSEARDEIHDQVGTTLRALTANLIDIVRGGGKPLELRRNVEALTAALTAFEGAAGRQLQAWEFAEMLRVNLEPKNSAPTSEEAMAELYAEHAIVQASLQLAATRLLRHEVEAAEAYAHLHSALSGLEVTKRKIEERRHDKHSDIHTETKRRP